MINPILERELKSKTRTWKMPLTISLYLIFIGLFSYAVYITNMPRFDGFDPTSIVNAYSVLVVVQLAMIMFVTPMLTATAISGERDRQTLDLMLCTDISPWKILFGKIFATLSTIMLLIVLSLPFLSIIFTLGGINFLDILKIFLYYMVSAFTMSTVAIYASAKFKKNITAIIMSYVILFIIYVVPFILFVIIGATAYNLDPVFIDTVLEPNAYLIIVLLFGWNPGFGVLSLLNISPNSIIGFPSGSAAVPWLLDVPAWVISLVFMSIISIVSLLRAKAKLAKKS